MENLRYPRSCAGLVRVVFSVVLHNQHMGGVDVAEPRLAPALVRSGGGDTPASWWICGDSKVLLLGMVGPLRLSVMS